MIAYCTTCVMPDTRPDVDIQDGQCGACHNYAQRGAVDWAERDRALCQILEHHHNPSGYDCIVPVSGGKDSTFQVLKLLALGANPLCVTATTCDLSEIGRANIENLKSLGVDYVEVTTNPRVRAKLNRLALTTIGDISWPEHVSIFTIPVRLSVQMKIPLIVWGENPQNEYGGPAAAAEGHALTRQWLGRFGGLLGMRAEDILKRGGFDARDLVQYQYPSDEDLASTGTTGIFLGYYYPWDGCGNAMMAQAHGMTTYGRAVEGAMVDYENLDNVQTGIHDYFCWLKHGFGRATQQASLHVRRGRITRDDALDVVAKCDGKFPWTYLGVPIEETLGRIGMSLDEFIAVCDRFTNREIFRTRSGSGGQLWKDEDGNLERINDDNE